MDGHKYEYACAEKLKKSGFSRVKVTKGSGDQGIDIIAYKNGKKYGIQCKYYSSPVGNKAVQEAFSGAKFNDCDIAAVMTNNTFTKSAHELANKLDVKLWAKKSVQKSFKNNRISLWKIVNYFVAITGILCLISIFTFDDIRHPVLQSLYAISMILSGLFGAFNKHEGNSIIASCFFYFATILIAAINDIAFKNMSSDPLIFLIPFLYSLCKSYKLIKPKKEKYIEHQKTEDVEPLSNQSISIWQDDVLSISNMQRKYRISYKHANNIVNILYVNGYISEKNDNGDRTANCSKEIIEALIEKNIELWNPVI